MAFQSVAPMMGCKATTGAKPDQGLRPIRQLLPARFGGIAAVSVMVLSWQAFAQLPQAVLDSVYPPGGLPGSTHTVTIHGTDLDDPVGLVFDDARVTARPRAGAPSTFEVTIPAGVAMGAMDVRFVGRFGVSNPRVYRIDGVPAVSSDVTNSTSASAIKVHGGSAAWGKVAAGGAAWFEMDARAGQRVLARVLASEIDSRLSPMLVAFGMEGREWARARRSGLLDFVAPSNGPVRVQVLDAQYRGGDGYFFRFENVQGPHVELAVPCVLTAGTNQRVTLVGRRLPGGRPSGLKGADGVALEQVEVEMAAPSIPAQALRWPVDALRRGSSASVTPWTWPWHHASHSPAVPVVFALTHLPVVAQAVPGSPSRPVATEPVAVRPPVEVGGWLGGSATAVTFDCKKGDAWWIEAWADRLGQLADVVAIVQREETTPDKPGRWVDVTELAELDANPASAELNVSSRDAAGRFEAPQDGKYRVVVRDAFGAGKASGCRPFRLAIRKPSPDFRAWAWAQPPPKSNNDDRRAHAATPTLRRGGTVPVRVAVARLEGFEAPVDVSATGLPTGVSAMPARIHAGQTSGTLLLTASEDASPGGFALVLKASAVVASSRVERPVLGGGVPWAVADFNQEPIVSRLYQSLHGGVVPEPEPVVVAAAGGDVFECKAGGKLSIPLRVLRRFEFPAAFNLKPAGHPAFDKAKEVAVPEKATNVTAEVSLADAALPVGEHVIWFHGQVGGKYRNQHEAVAVAAAAVKSAMAALGSASAAEKGGKEQAVKSAEAALKSAEERAKPRDVTVGVWSAPVRVRILPAK